MPLASYPILCYRPACGQLAVFKIAARWSDGITQELKTYSLSCPDCLASLYQDACSRQAACRLAPGEVLEVPGVYELIRGTRDRQLARRLDLEQTLAETLVRNPARSNTATEAAEEGNADRGP
jgi:hypothetical protein